jgi:site-specific DNA recombinase
MKKRAILYPRVSTDEQAADGYSLPTQLEGCRKYVRDNGFDIVAELVEDYTGTVPIEDRPEGSKVYAMLANDEADVLVAYRMNRIVRPPEEGDEWDIPILIRSLAKLGKEIHTCDRGHIGTSFGDLITAVLDGRSAGDERREFLERSKRGKRGKVRGNKDKGIPPKPFCGGTVPYGYKVNEQGLFEIDEAEAKVVKLIYDWYTNGESMSMGAITRRLSEMGISTPGESRTNYRIRESGMWNPSTIFKILRNELYYGVWHFTSTASGHPEKIAVSVPAIVSKEQWQAAQARKDYNRLMSRRNNKTHKYLLRGMVQCGCGCESNMRGGANGQGTRYYRVRKVIYPGEAPRCTRNEKSIRADMLESAAWEYLLNTITNHEELEARLKEAQELEQQTKQPKRDRLSVVMEMIGEAEDEAKTILRDLRDRPQGVVREMLERQEVELNTRYEKLIRERDKLQEEIEVQSITDQDIEQALSFQDAVKAGLENPTWEDKRYYLETLRFQAVIDEDRAHFSCYLDIGDCALELTAQACCGSHD